MIGYIYSLFITLGAQERLWIDWVRAACLLGQRGDIIDLHGSRGGLQMTPLSPGIDLENNLGFTLL